MSFSIELILDAPNPLDDLWTLIKRDLPDGRRKGVYYLTGTATVSVSALPPNEQPTIWERMNATSMISFQDMGGLSATPYRRIVEVSVAWTKELGCNSILTSILQTTIFEFISGKLLVNAEEAQIWDLASLITEPEIEITEFY